MSARPGILKRDVRTVGLLIETLCYGDAAVYASAIGGNVHYYRDNSDLEIDIVIQLGDGR